MIEQKTISKAPTLLALVIGLGAEGRSHAVVSGDASWPQFRSWTMWRHSITFAKTHLRGRRIHAISM